MPQSLSVVYLHLVFSTKERRPFLRDKSLRLALHAYLGGISKTLDCPPLIVGGVEDHVHRKMTFQDELRALLRKHEAAWDERYLWD